MMLLLGPEIMFAKCDKHYPSRSRQTSLATAVTQFTKPVGNINSGPSTSLTVSVGGRRPGAALLPGVGVGRVMAPADDGIDSRIDSPTRTINVNKQCSLRRREVAHLWGTKKGERAPFDVSARLGPTKRTERAFKL